MANDNPCTFVSYARNDSEFALRLTRDLRGAGATVWLDQLDIAPGQLWDQAVENALRSSPRVLVVLSPRAVESNNVMDEVSFALEQRKRVIPVLHRDCTIPFRLRRLQYVDMRTEYASRLAELLETLNVQKPASTDKPTLFIGSASDDLAPAFIADEALRDCARGIVWDRTTRTSTLSQSWLEPLLDALDEADFGLFVFGPRQPADFRDEVMFELGLMVGRFGRERSFLIMPKDTPAVQLPSGSLGLHTAVYSAPAELEQLPLAMATAFNEIRRPLQQYNPRPLPIPSGDETGFEIAAALAPSQKNHLLNLGHGKTKGYQGRGSLRFELRQLVLLGLVERLPGRNIGEMQTGALHDLADIVRLTDRGRQWVERMLKHRNM